MRNKNLRMCVVCRQHKTKEELFRFVIKDDKLKYDATYKENCRGYYICKDENCIKKVHKIKFFNNMLKGYLLEEEFEEIEFCLKK